MNDWKYIEDGYKNLGTIDMSVKSKELGEAGRELIDMSARSSDPNTFGFKTEETWVFKRTK